MFYQQLRLWDLSVDLAKKIQEEKKAKVSVFYHFCGEPLLMSSRASPLGN